MVVREDGSVRVSTPARYPARDVPVFLHKYSDWILGTITSQEKIRNELSQQIASGQMHALFLGEDYPVTLQRVGISYGIQWSEDGFHVEIPSGISPEREMALVSALFDHWYGIRARKYLPGRVHALASRIGVHIARVSIRNQRTRWGSCSEKGNINLGLRLMAAPPEVIDHIILHELAHRLEMNHSPAFWAIVAAHDPNWKAHKAWLRRNNKRMTFP
jgi:predicted metal-dependent hydrolase